MGEAMILFLASSGHPLTLADRFNRSVAGAEATVAVGARRLGLRTGWISRVGADAFGEVIRRTMRAEDVQTHISTDPDRPTGLLVRDMPALGPVQVQYYRAGSAASMLSESDVGDSIVAQARLLHLTGITAMLSDTAHAAVLAAHGQARAAGRLVSFDPNIRRTLGTTQQWADRIAPIAAASHIVLSGAEELIVITGTADENVAVDSLLDTGVNVVVVKDGAHGSRAYTRHESVAVSARQVLAVDPVGAGDAFAAGFLARLLTDHPQLRGGDVPDLASLERALQSGSVVAAATVASSNDLDGLPFATDLDSLNDVWPGDVRR